MSFYFLTEFFKYIFYKMYANAKYLTFRKYALKQGNRIL
jgi:hypothetical protein